MAVGYHGAALYVIASGDNRTVRVRRLADGAPLAPRWTCLSRYGGVAFQGNIIITAIGRDIAIHNHSLHDPCEVAPCTAAPADRQRPSDNGRLSGTTQAPASDHAGGGPPPSARLGHVIRYIC